MKTMTLMGAALLAIALPSHAELTADNQNALMGMLRGVFVHERCTGQRFSVEALQAFDDRIVATVMLHGPSRKEVVDAFPAMLTGAQITTPARPKAADCRDAKKLVKLLASM
jgi:hypothetical protein